MDHSRREIRRALLVCIPYLIIIFFLDDLDKLLYAIHSGLGNPLLVVYMFLATVIILACFIHTIINLKRNYKESGYIAVAPMMIYLVALTNSFWSPLRISSDIFHTKIVYSAFRRDRDGYTKMRMRKNGNFDIRYQGPFGMAEWEYGKWSERGDTFYLNYDKDRDTGYLKPDTLILSDGLLAPIGIPSDTLKKYKDGFFRMPIISKK
jgi:hypothetical protein